ncbi:MAG: hypothetical protein KA077_04065, partial [Veillonella sp.]|nr:hypothetical protein [Veillonella sp.]
EAGEMKTLSESIFGKQVRIITLLQESAYADNSYQEWRQSLVDVCHSQVVDLNTALFAVKNKLKYVVKYKDIKAFTCLSEGDKGELLEHIAPLVHLDDDDELAKRFDNFMYGLILATIEQMPSFKRAKKELCDTALLLEKKISIPQVKAKLPLIKDVQTDEFWAANDILLFEKVRVELRELIKFLDRTPGRTIITRLTDPVTMQTEGNGIDDGYDFEDYREKVNRYIGENGNSLAIYKLTHNIKLTHGDYQELARVLTEELGSEVDYRREYGDTPFGLLVRKIAKLDHEAAMQAFSTFINDEGLNHRQINFVYKIINHIEKNGYMEDTADLQKPPFDKPINFIKLFDQKTRLRLLAAINEIRDNAVNLIS